MRSGYLATQRVDPVDAASAYIFPPLGTTKTVSPSTAEVAAFPPELAVASGSVQTSFMVVASMAWYSPDFWRSPTRTSPPDVTNRFGEAPKSTSPPRLGS